MTTDIEDRLAVLEGQMRELRDDVRSLLAIMNASTGLWKFVIGLAATISSITFAASTWAHWK